MESRKRPLGDVEDDTRPKKRNASDGLASPSHVNGLASGADEPRDGDNLEMFRKDAIYRRMKFYSREHERSQARVAELERRRDTCEAGLAALEACWTQLIGTIRALVKPEDLPPLDIVDQGLFDLSATVVDPETEYAEALRDRMQATTDIVTAFVRLNGQSQPSPLKDDRYQAFQKAQTENSSLRSELSLVRSQLRDAETQKEQFREELVAAEKRIDRLQSKTLAALHAQPQEPEMKKAEPVVKDESPKESPSSPAPLQPAINGDNATEAITVELEDLKSIAQLREDKIKEMSDEIIGLREEVQELKLKLKEPAEESFKLSPTHNLMKEQIVTLEHYNKENRKEIDSLNQIIATLQNARQEYEEACAAAAEQAVSELKIMLAKRDNENARLREQRDQQLSELNERKQKEHVKLSSLNEFKSLAETRGDRIIILESELARLKTRLAANEGDEDLMSFLFKSTSEGASYVEHLKTQLATAENRIAALEASLSYFQEDNPDVIKHIKGEAEARQRLTDVEKQLERYKSVYGDASSALPPDVKLLSEQLQQKHEENSRLKLQEQQREQAESALYAELDKLSAAWEALDRQVKSKVFDLSAMEERLVKNGLDRAKSENKYYSSMRDKEALENERKNLSRNLEKQAKVVEKLADSEKSLSSRLAAVEKENFALRKAFTSQKNHIEQLSLDVEAYKTKLSTEMKQADNMRASIREQEKGTERRRAELRRMEEYMLKMKREAERNTAKMKDMAINSTASSSTKEAQLQSEVDKCMSILKCSTCKMNMRNTVITKCMHSFCKSCVESRIATRQRKCPACNLPFSQGEVQTLFFQ